MAYAISSGKVTWEDLKGYRRNFKDGKKFKNYLKRRPDHESDVHGMILDIKCADLFLKID
jgi:hypothetical protein